MVVGNVKSGGVPVEMVEWVISLINIFRGFEGFLL